MAPAIVHFLIGAAVLLFVAAPFALRYETGRNEVLWVVPIGGIWGLVPDFHHISPYSQEWLYSIHSTPWVDLLGLHYTLDRPLIRSMYFESVFGSILVFVGAVGLFSLSSSVRNRRILAKTGRERALVTVGALVIAAGYAGFATGVVLSAMGELETVALLIGREGLLISGLLFAPLSLLGGVIVWAPIRVVGSEEHQTHPLQGGLLGLATGFVSWGVFGAVMVPVWLRFAGIGTAPLPLFHRGSLAGILVFCLVFGLVYATVRGAFVSGVDGTHLT